MAAHCSCWLNINWGVYCRELFNIILVTSCIPTFLQSMHTEGLSIQEKITRTNFERSNGRMVDKARLTCQPATHPTGRAKLYTARQVRLSNYKDKAMDNIDTFQQLWNLSNFNFNFRWFVLSIYMYQKKGNQYSITMCVLLYLKLCTNYLVFDEKKIYKKYTIRGQM